MWPNLFWVEGLPEDKLVISDRNLVINNDVAWFSIVIEPDAKSTSLLPLFFVTEEYKLFSGEFVAHYSKGRHQVAVTYLALRDIGCVNSINKDLVWGTIKAESFPLQSLLQFIPN